MFAGVLSIAALLSQPFVLEMICANHITDTTSFARGMSIPALL